MKSIHKTLKLIKKEFKNNPCHLGLCSAALSLFIVKKIKKKQLKEFKKYLYNNTNHPYKPHLVGYIWSMHDRQSRIKWLEKHIKITKPMKTNRHQPLNKKQLRNAMILSLVLIVVISIALVTLMPRL